MHDVGIEPIVDPQQSMQMPVDTSSQEPGTGYAVVVDEQVQASPRWLGYIQQDVSLATLGTRLQQRLGLQVRGAVQVNQIVTQRIGIHHFAGLHMDAATNESILDMPRTLDAHLAEATFDQFDMYDAIDNRLAREDGACGGDFLRRIERIDLCQQTVEIITGDTASDIRLGYGGQFSGRKQYRMTEVDSLEDEVRAMCEFRCMACRS